MRKRLSISLSHKFLLSVKNIQIHRKHLRRKVFIVCAQILRVVHASFRNIIKCLLLTVHNHTVRIAVKKTK